MEKLRHASSKCPVGNHHLPRRNGLAPPFPVIGANTATAIKLLPTCALQSATGMAEVGDVNKHLVNTLATTFDQMATVTDARRMRSLLLRD